MTGSPSETSDPAGAEVARAPADAPSGAIATVGSFCLFVGKRAVAFDPASQAICGWFAWLSVADVAIAVPAAATTRMMAMSNASGDLRMDVLPEASAAAGCRAAMVSARSQRPFRGAAGSNEAAGQALAVLFGTLTC